MILVLWDIDRTLLYTGGIDRQVYRELFEEVVGRPVVKLPARGTGVTMPLAVLELLRVNSVEAGKIRKFADDIVRRMPAQLLSHQADIADTGRVMPGALASLKAVGKSDELLPTVVTGNLRESAAIKLRTLELDRYLDLDIGGYSSDDAHRPSLVAVAQRRAGRRHGHEFTPQNTVIIGDSLEDVRTGQEGGAAVIGVASGTTRVDELTSAGARHVIPDLRDPHHLLQLIHECASK
ncbi:HAD hydrolase-like protein [Streptomyces sp. NPDC046985]|uniref:HAD family hydrolase n=1 Tax=Streptomyces sp. NPDC046985 TaxID=3155377 RepID=UPI0033C496DF